MLQWEKSVVQKMIHLYCRQHHGKSRQALCQDCRDLLDYAQNRLHHCQFGAGKPTCEKCPVHCYEPPMREKMKTVMRYAGPRMIIRHPADAWKHLLRKRQRWG